MLNEAALIKDEFAGILLRVDRNDPDKIDNPQHKSECELIAYDKWDAVLDNNGTIEELFAQIDKLMRDLKR
jgi:dephospho-CoA kinase